MAYQFIFLFAFFYFETIINLVLTVFLLILASFCDFPFLFFFLRSALCLPIYILRHLKFSLTCFFNHAFFKRSSTLPDFKACSLTKKFVFFNYFFICEISQLTNFIIFISAPTKSPEIQGAFGSDASTIQFDLIPPRPYYAAYEITGYNVCFWKSETNTSYQIKTFPVETVTVNLTSLDFYTKYCLSAAAINSYGTGNYGSCTTAMTNESGNSLLSWSSREPLN